MESFKKKKKGDMWHGMLVSTFYIHIYKDLR